MIQKFHITMSIPQKKGHESPNFGAFDFSKYVQNSLLQKPMGGCALVIKRVSEKDETLHFGCSINFDYPSKVACEKVREIVSHIPGLNSSIHISVSPE